MKEQNFLSSLELLEKLEKKNNIKLSFLERLLVVTNGSVTQILEVFYSKPVSLKTISQVVTKASPKEISFFDLKSRFEINNRSVIISVAGHPLILAKSKIPLEKLEEGFRDELMLADVPIGKLLIKHKIEARRELVHVDFVSGSSELDSVFGSGNQGYIVRTYNIIHKGSPWLNITESFPIR